MEAFRTAVEGGDVDAAVALLADDVEFRSPAVHRPSHGRAAVEVVLRTVVEVFEDFRYDRAIGDPDGRDHALVFRARIGDRDVEGIDLLRLDDDGLVTEFVVMVRPLSGLLALVEQMQARLPG
jgi:hypothetical protein